MIIVALMCSKRAKQFNAIANDKLVKVQQEKYR